MKILQLRELLAERLPPGSFTNEAKLTRNSCVVSTGSGELDRVLGGGLPVGELTELVGHGSAAGTGVVLRRLLRERELARDWVALIDGSDCFDPASCRGQDFSRLLWVRCQNAFQATRAADLLLRDGNVKLLVLDLFLNPAVECQRIPASTWFRFQRLVSHHGTTFLTITRRRVIPAARNVVAAVGRFSLSAMESDEPGLLDKLRFRLVREKENHSSAANELRSAV